MATDETTGPAALRRVIELLQANKFVYVSEQAEQRFAEMDRAAEARTTRKAFEAWFGWAPSAEYAAFDVAVRALEPNDQLCGGIWELLPAPGKPGTQHPFTDFEVALLPLTGFVRFARGLWGSDSAWVSTLPSDDGFARVYDHDEGTVQSQLTSSVGDFVARYLERSEPVDAATMSGWVGEAARALAQQEVRQVPAWCDGQQLFARSQWLLAVADGSPDNVEYYMGAAPTLASYHEEKARFAQAPWLAAYWLLAHAFLSNVECGREALELSARAPGKALRQLEDAVRPFFEGEPRPFAQLTSALLASAIKRCAKNALPSQREGAARAGSTDVDRAAIAAALAEGADPFELMTRYPADVGLHDELLTAAVKREPALEDRVDGYLKARVGATADEWPWFDKDLEPRLSLPVAAAFRSGLAYGEHHDHAFAGITRTLAKFDDDHALDAYAAAIEALSVDDGRLACVVDGLNTSAHPRAGELLARAAEMTFARVEDARATAADRDADVDERGLTLDTLFPAANHLLGALALVFRRGGEVAERLAFRALSDPEVFPVLRRQLGSALRVAGDRGMSGHASTARRIVETFAAAASTELGLDATQVVVAAEAGIAWAKLDPEAARPVLRGLFETEREHALATVDSKAAAIGGLVLLDGVDRYLPWLDRLLGNRSNPARLGPALRAVAEAKVAQAIEWVRPHVYSPKNPFLGEQWLEQLAREAMAALGAPELPPMAINGEHGESLKKVDQLVGGFAHPELHHATSLCDRIVESKRRSPQLLRPLSALAREALRYSADNRPGGDDGSTAALKALALQGHAGEAALAELVSLPHIDHAARAYVLLNMRLTGEEAIALVKAVTIPLDHALDQLREPTEPRWLARLDLLAARLVLDRPERCGDAVEAALRWRYQRTGGHHNGLALDVARLPLVFARLGTRALPTLNELARRHGDDRELKTILGAALKLAKRPPDAIDERPADKLVQKALARGWTLTLGFKPAALQVTMTNIQVATFPGNRRQWTGPMSADLRPRIQALSAVLGMRSR